MLFEKLGYRTNRTKQTIPILIKTNRNFSQNFQKFQLFNIHGFLHRHALRDTVWTGKNTKNRVNAMLNASFRGKNKNEKIKKKKKTIQRKKQSRWAQKFVSRQV